MTLVIAMLKDTRIWCALGLSIIGARAVAQSLARFLYPRHEHRRHLFILVIWGCFSAVPLLILRLALQSSLVFLLLPWEYAKLIMTFVKEPSVGVWKSFMFLFICGTPLCLVLGNHLAVLKERLTDSSGQWTFPLFLFAAIGTFFLSMVIDPVYGASATFQGPRFAGFAVYAVAASMEAGFAYYALKNNRKSAPDLAAACLFAAAAATDSMAASLMLLPLLPIRIRYLSTDTDSEMSAEDEQDESLDELGEHIIDLRRALNNARAGIVEAEVRNPEFWLLPPDHDVLQRMINDGTLILPETANNVDSLDIYIGEDQQPTDTVSG